MLQTAHQPAAGAGDLGGIQGQTLFLCHLDGNRLEISQIALAAEFPAANAQPPQELCLVPDANLPQLDAGAEHACQILHQFPEIHPVFRRKVKQQLAVVEGAFHLHQLHIQLPEPDLFLADPEGVLFLFLVLCHHCQILRRGKPDDLLEGSRDLLLRDFLVGKGNLAAFHAPGGFHDGRIPHLRLNAVGCKVIDLAHGLEAYSYDLCHVFILIISCILRHDPGAKCGNRQSRADISF